ncbi:MAG: DinB family protein [Bacteroidetes bacterium]|nr:DinB family protein [Bacteroidota bacterium]
MKELLYEMSAYNLWATQRLLSVVASLTEEQLQKILPSSFGSVKKTLLHIWNAESIWWQRMKLQERILAPSENFEGEIKTLHNEILIQSTMWKDWTEGASEMMLEHVLQYHNTKKEYFKQPCWQIVFHVFNHTNYHRGQLVNMLRQLNIENIPATDFIVWSRHKK